MSERGERTRNKLLEVATAMFSEKGFEGVSTRDLVRAAETTLPSITHHFGSKEGLYQAVLASIWKHVAITLLPAYESVSDTLAQPHISHDDALEALQILLRAQTEAVLSGEVNWTAIVVREQLHPSGALSSLDAGMKTHLLTPVARLVGILRNLPADDETVKLQTLSLISRTMILRTARTAALEFMDWPALTPVVIERFTMVLREEVNLLYGTK